MELQLPNRACNGRNCRIRLFCKLFWPLSTQGVCRFDGPAGGFLQVAGPWAALSRKHSQACTLKMRDTERVSPGRLFCSSYKIKPGRGAWGMSHLPRASHFFLAISGHCMLARWEQAAILHNSRDAVPITLSILHNCVPFPWSGVRHSHTWGP